MNVEKLIEQGESNTLEFKESLQLSESIGKTISSLSNASGGTILIGSQEAELPPLTSGTALVI